MHVHACMYDLQVLLDMLDLEELSDYLRLMCCRLKTHRPKGRTTSAASSASQAASKRPSSSTTATAERPPSTTRTLGKWRLALASTAGSLQQAGRLQACPAAFLQDGRHARVCAVRAQ